MKINFIKYTKIYFAISGIVIGLGLFSLIIWKLQPSIDFVGGSLAQIHITPKEGEIITENAIRVHFASKRIEAHSIQQAGVSEWIIRMKQHADDVQDAMVESLSDLGKAEIVRFESVGPTLGRELLIKTLYGIILAALGIMVYLAWRFRGKEYGIAAILAMIHDSLIVIGIFSLLGHFYGVEIDTLFVTAVLTILSFSVHDTIVVFDRIRENLTRLPKHAFEDIANRSINETMGRSVKNSLAIIFVLTALTVLGGQTIKYFSLALLVGTITGTYSSPFIAVPLLVVWERWKRKGKRTT